VFLVARVALRPSDGGLNSIIAGIPSKVGLPVLGQQEMWIESMTLSLLGRPPGASQPFMTMPTGCKPATATAVATSAANTTATRSAPPFTPTACAKLPFKPSLQATLTNGTLPALRTVISGPPGNANTASAAVVLPPGLGVNLDALQNICTCAQQAAGQCPEPSRVGRAAAHTPLLPPLAGPVYLAELPGQVLPGLRVFLSGTVSMSLAGTVDALTGHNGAVANLRVPVTVTGCAKPAATIRVRGRKLVLRVNAVRDGPALTFVRLTLPRKLKAHPGRGKVSQGRLTRRGVLTIRTAAVRHLTATLRGGAFTRRTRKGALKFKLTTIDASRRRVHQTVKARR
jgi:hypothetical protein